MSVSVNHQGPRASCPCGWSGAQRSGVHGLMAAIGDDDLHARSHAGGRRVDLDVVYPPGLDPSAPTLFGTGVGS